MFGSIRFVRVLERACAVLFILMTLLLFAQVVLRYVFAASLFWAEELARFSMVWLVFLGSVMAACTGAHTRIGFFVDLLPAVPRRCVEGGVTLVCAAAAGTIAWYGLTVARLGMLSKSPAMGLPLGYVYSAAPLCCGLMALILLGRAVAQFLGWTQPGGPAEKSGGEPS